MPVQRDYILRLIEQGGAVVRRLRELLSRGRAQPSAIVEEARAAQADLFGETWPLLQRVDVPTATGLIRDARQLSIWAELLYLEAEADRALGEVGRAEELEARAAAIEAAVAREKSSS